MANKTAKKAKKMKREKERRLREATTGQASPTKAPQAPDGRREINRAADRKTAELNAFPATVTRRAAMFGMSRADAARQEAGTALGRMWQSGEIDRAQRDAGERFHEVVSDYLEATGAPPPTAQAQDLNRVQGHEDHHESAGDVARARGARDKYEAMIVATAGYGRAISYDAYQALRRITVEGEGADTLTPKARKNVRLYLAVIAAHFGITNGGER